MHNVFLIRMEKIERKTKFLINIKLSVIRTLDGSLIKFSVFVSSGIYFISANKSENKISLLQFKFGLMTTCSCADTDILYPIIKNK